MEVDEELEEEEEEERTADEGTEEEASVNYVVGGCGHELIML